MNEPAHRALNLAVRALAVQRLTQLIVQDAITEPIRARIGDWASGHPSGSLRERIDYAVNCGACSSVWASAAVLALCHVPGGEWIIRILAGSGAALTLDAAVNRLDR